jgi:hypothetical protein
MVQIQFDLDEHTDKNLRIYMAYNNITSKTDALGFILSEYFLIKPPKFETGILPKKENVITEEMLSEEAIERGSHIIPEDEEKL